MESTSLTPSGRQQIPRARPVIELNLNVEDAMIEAVDLLRTIRVQLESITSTVNQRLNRTFSDAGDDVTKIIQNVETLSSNLAASTGQLYQPLLFSVLFLLLILILIATFFCIACHIRKQLQCRNRRKRSKSSEKNLEEAMPLEGAEDSDRKKTTKQKRTPPFWLRRFRSKRTNGKDNRSASKSPELEELREKEPKTVELHEAGTIRQ